MPSEGRVQIVTCANSPDLIEIWDDSVVNGRLD